MTSPARAAVSQARLDEIMIAAGVGSRAVVDGISGLVRRKKLKELKLRLHPDRALHNKLSPDEAHVAFIWLSQVFETSDENAPPLPLDRPGYVQPSSKKRSPSTSPASNLRPRARDRSFAAASSPAREPARASAKPAAAPSFAAPTWLAARLLKPIWLLWFTLCVLALSWSAAAAGWATFVCALSNRFYNVLICAATAARAAALHVQGRARTAAHRAATTGRRALCRLAWLRARLRCACDVDGGDIDGCDGAGVDEAGGCDFGGDKTSETALLRRTKQTFDEAFALGAVALVLATASREAGGGLAAVGARFALFGATALARTREDELRRALGELGTRGADAIADASGWLQPMADDIRERAARTGMAAAALAGATEDGTRLWLPSPQLLPKSPPADIPPHADVAGQPTRGRWLRVAETLSARSPDWPPPAIAAAARWWVAAPVTSPQQPEAPLPSLCARVAAPFNAQGVCAALGRVEQDHSAALVLVALAVVGYALLPSFGLSRSRRAVSRRASAS
ncbi:hypothetical protein T492DRAFT_1145720 [Pavlovales sp. CCMP2436]|nr:hypothetical protein T492DRAFT_1145720 [Pavlovales sp. CCMP2436]